MKKQRFVAAILVFVMCIGLLGGFQTVKADDLFMDLESGVSREVEAIPGTTTHVKVPVRALSVYISAPTFSGEVPDGAPFKITNVTLKKDNTVGEIMGLAVGEKAYLEFDIVMKETAKIGTYNMSIKASYTSYEYGDYNESTGSYNIKSCNIPMVVRVTKEKAPAQITISDITYDTEDIFIGETFNINFNVKNEGEITALNTYFSLEFGESGIVPAYSVKSQKLGDLKSGGNSKVTLPATVLSTATEGLKTLTVNFSYKDEDGEEKTSTENLYVTIKKKEEASSKEDAKIEIKGEKYEEDIKPGTSHSLKVNLENIGVLKATNVQVSIIKGTGKDEGIIEDYETQTLSVQDLEPNDKTELELPLRITDAVSEGLKEFTVQVSYKDSNQKEEDEPHTAQAIIYLMIKKDKQEEEDKLINELIMDNAVQSPSSPSAGETVTLTFSITNKGNNTAKEVRVRGDELSSNGFEPLTSDPYKSLGNLEPGAKVQVSMKFKVGKGISEGTNPLKISCEYKSENNEALQETATFYILNVKNDKEKDDDSSKSKPKLIVTDFGTDKEELKAGSTFELHFDLKNTHASKSARNITVTVKQKDDVFSVSEGSNSFYIDKIAPGETRTNTLPMKVKNDTATNSYEIEITLAYEYDDMPVIEGKEEGTIETATIKLQAVENARPVVQNVSVGNWDTPTVNVETAMVFDFYNMGKSPLNNVYFTLEGDFTLSTGTMFYLGTISAGSYEQPELTVLPNKEGTCSGKIIIHYEDSNGDEVTQEQEFNDVYVNAAYDPGMDDNMGDWNIPVDVSPTETVKPILPLWLFLVIQAGILVVVIPVVRMIGIKLHKKKLLKQDQV